MKRLWFEEAVPLADATNDNPETLEPLKETVRLLGLKMYPALLGVTVYDPLLRPLKEKLPLEFEVVVADVGPVRETVAPAPLAAGVIVPESVAVQRCLEFCANRTCENKIDITPVKMNIRTRTAEIEIIALARGIRPVLDNTTPFAARSRSIRQ